MTPPACPARLTKAGTSYTAITLGSPACVTVWVSGEGGGTRMPGEAYIVVRDLTMAYGSFVIQHDLTFTSKRW
jgi:hypothetical protein